MGSSSRYLVQRPSLNRGRSAGHEISRCERGGVLGDAGGAFSIKSAGADVFSSAEAAV